AEYDSNLSNNDATLSVPVRVVSNLGLTMTSEASSVPIGQPISFSMVVVNSGPTDEPDAVVNVPLPSGFNFLSCSASQGTSSTHTPSGVSVDLGPISVRGSATVRLTVSPLASALGLMTLTASATGYNANLFPAQAQALATVTVAPASGLS